MADSMTAYRLLHDASLVLAQMSEAGLRLDEPYVHACVADAEAEMVAIKARLTADPVFARWRAHFGDRTSLGAKAQLAVVLFDLLGYPNKGYTEKTEDEEDEADRRYKADEEAFAHVDLPFVKDYFRLAKLDKLVGTYLKGLLKEAIDGYVHPVFNLHTVQTYRGSCSSPNVQNQLNRHPEMAERLRRCFVPRPGRRFAEVDFSTMEFRISASFWRDDVMIAYASDPSKDVHRDQAAALFLCDKAQVSKPMRQAAKNQLVFPLLYGSYYVSCTENLWHTITKTDLRMQDDTLVVDWLKTKGVTERGRLDPKTRPRSDSYEGVVQSVERGFLDQFRQFAENKEKWIEAYQAAGRFRMPTGFVCRGLYSKNFLLNAPVQGVAFHCLLQALIWLQRWLERNNMRTLIVAQIHDCILFDAADDELQDVLHAARHYMTTKLRRHWPWLLTDLEVEVDVTDIDGAWSTKKPWIEENGVWRPKSKK